MSDLNNNDDLNNWYNNDNDDQNNENDQNDRSGEEANRVHSVNPDYVFDRLDGSDRSSKSNSKASDLEEDENETTSSYEFMMKKSGNYEQNGYQIPSDQPKPKRSNATQAVIGLIISLGVFVLLIGGLWLASSRLGTNGNNQQQPSGSGDGIVAEATKESEKATVSETVSPSKTNVSMTKGEIGTTGNVSATLLDVSPVVDNVFSSVVAVTNTTIYKPIYSMWGSGSQEASGAGSGVIVAQNDTELLIVTNAHVVLPESYQNYSVSSCVLTVKFANEVECDAYMKGYDSQMDLAVIAVDLSSIDEATMKEIKIASIGDSDELKVGNGVIAIGNALGFGLSVTVGYVSALNREITFSDGSSRILLQTDAAINPGNSGGGLFDIYGNLVGINSAKYSDESVEGIGYAIPITTAREKIEELMNMEPRKKVTDENKKCAIGISLSSAQSSWYQNEGAFISAVTEGGPADQAGLMAYDIITEINGTKITCWDDLKEELSYYEGGETITVKYLSLESNRKYKEKTTTITLGYAKDLIVNE